MDLFEMHTQFRHAQSERFTSSILIPWAVFLHPLELTVLLPDPRLENNAFLQEAQGALANDVIHLRRSNRRCSWGAYSDYLLNVLQQFEWLHLNDFLLAKTIAKPSAFA